MVSSSEALDVVEIVYFAPALFISLYVCYKQGFSREAGWLLLSILSLVRLLGGALGIAAIQNPRSGLFTASLVLGSIGSATLVAAFTGVVNRIESGSEQSHLPLRFRRLLQLISIVAIVMGSIGGSKVTSSDQVIRSDGYTYIKVSTALILVQYLAATFILCCSAVHMHAILPMDRKLFFLVSAAGPFVLIRVIYSLCAAFNPTSETFSPRSSTLSSVAIRGVLAIAMEIIAVTLLIIGGFVSPKMHRREQMHTDTPVERYTPKTESLEVLQYQHSTGRAPGSQVA